MFSSNTYSRYVFRIRTHPESMYRERRRDDRRHADAPADVSGHHCFSGSLRLSVRWNMAMMAGSGR
jgi:hypothetical protein